MLAGMWNIITRRNRMVQPLWKTLWQFLTKLNMYPVKHNPSFGIYLREINILCSHKKLYTNVYSSSIHNPQT